MKHRSHQSLVCSNGHEFEVPSPEVLGEFVLCPECRARVAVDSSTEPTRNRTGGRGLWQLMGQSAEANPETDHPVDATAEATQLDEPDSLSPPTTESSTKPAALGFKALWQRAVAGDLPAAFSVAESAVESAREAVKPQLSAAALPSDSPQEKPRGLWAVMGTPAADIAASPSLAPATLNRPETATLDDDDGSAGDEIDDSMDAIAEPISTPAPAVNSSSRDREGVSIHKDLRPLPDGRGSNLQSLSAAAERKVRQVVRRALTLGVIGLLLAPLNLTPFLGLKVPAVVCGLMAVIWGYETWHESRRSTERKRLARLSITAMACGLIATLAGPAGLNALGKSWQQGALQEGAAANLHDIGRALDEFHAQHGYYPNGETVSGSKGEGVGQQSWLTELLPFFGRTDLLRQIDLRQPYDHPANHLVMSRPVPAFLVPGVPHEANKQGLATTHFAGVGGQRSDQFGQVNLGIFGRNTTITRSEVTDGLSQTMVVGEVAQRLPAWGDPENWRAIETGLNKHAYGFGNASNTGAHFLMADGSVRFFLNKTDLQVLEKLSSRDGADPVTLDE